MAEENTKYLTGEELIKRWRIKAFDLCRLMETDRREFSKVFFYPDNPKDPFKLSIEEVLNAFFPLETIEAFEEKHPEYKPLDTPYTAKDGETPDYFSKELKIAISTCHALYGPDGILTPGDGKDHRDEIIKYLFKHHRKSLSKGGFPIRCKVETYLKPDPGKLPAGIDRITTMINLNPNPGRKKSQS